MGGKLVNKKFDSVDAIVLKPLQTIVGLVCALCMCCQNNEADGHKSAISAAKRYVSEVEFQRAVGFDIDTTKYPSVKLLDDGSYAVVFGDKIRNASVTVYVYPDGECEASMGPIDKSQISVIDINKQTEAARIARVFLADSSQIKTLGFVVDEAYSATATEYQEGHFDVIFLDSLRNVYVQVIVRYGIAVRSSSAKIVEGAPSVLDSLNRGQVK